MIYITTKDKYTTVSFKLHENTKNQANNLFHHLGLTMSSALKLFIHQSLIKHGIPFQSKDSNYSSHTQETVDRAIKNLSNNNIKKHHLIEKG